MSVTPKNTNPKLTFLSFFLYFHKSKEKCWCEGVGRSRNVSFGRQNVKGQKCQCGFNTAAYPTGRQREWQQLEGIWRCFWFTDMVLLSLWVPNKVLAGWLACLAVEPGLMGLMEFECRSLISQLWWLADRSWWIAGAEGSPDSHAWLMNCEMRQTYKSCGQPRPPPPTGQPVWQWVLQRSNPSSTLVMWAAQLGSIETHRPALGPGLKSFNDGLWPSITLAFLLNVVLAVYPLK